MKFLKNIGGAMAPLLTVAPPLLILTLREPDAYLHIFVLFYHCKKRVFWLNITKFEVNWCYRYCFNLFSNLRKESELWQYHCQNSTKVGERKIKSRREKFFIFGNGIAAIPSAHSVAWVSARNVSARKENQMTWKKKCYEICERVKKKVVMSTIFLQHFHNKSHMISYY